MLAGAPSSAAPPLLAATRGAEGLVCPRCDAPSEHGAMLCDYCGVTLGEPPRRSGMTQRAMALDAESARRVLGDATPTAVPPVAPVARKVSFWEGVLVVLTLGLGWLWVRRRLA